MKLATTPKYRPALPPAHAVAEPFDNELLSALLATAWNRCAPQLRPVSLAAGDVLCEAGATPLHAVFPVDAVVSLAYITRDGASAEVAAIGREGMVGLPLLMGGGSMSLRAVVQAAGSAWRLPALVLRDEVQRCGPALSVLLRWVMALAVQVAQSAACNRHHSIEQQLCRRLLIALDSGGGDGRFELLLTHEAAAQLLGVRRESVTAAALSLQQAGVIRYHRGRVEVLSRPALEQRSCECYASARRERQRLLLVGTQMARFTEPTRPTVCSLAPPAQHVGR